MLKKKVQTQKPIEHDINLKYNCPTCDQHHWLAFREAKTKNFKVVCDCNTVFKVKRISAFKIKYEPDKILENKPFEIDTSIPKKIQVPLELLNKACKLFISYGFTKKESEKLLQSSYEKNPVDDYSTFIKNTLELVKENKDDVQTN